MDAGGELPPGIHLHHMCGNKLCVNAEHMQTMTLREHALLHAREYRKLVCPDCGSARTYMPQRCEWRCKPCAVRKRTDRRRRLRIEAAA